jgi:hypothetical protein
MFDQARLGKAPAKFDARTLRLGRYLEPGLPEPPPAACNSRHLPEWGEMLNQDLGCCTISACGHATQIWVLSHIQANVKAKPIPVDDESILHYYQEWAGYVPGDESTDQGAVALDILTCWRKQGFRQRKIKAFVSVNPRDLRDVQRAIHLFGGLYIGLALPISAAEQPWWDTVPGPRGRWNSWGGHAVYLPDYDSGEGELTCITWGKLQRMTEAFFTEYCDEAYAILAEDWRSPDGFDLATLEKDLRRVTA